MTLQQQVPSLELCQRLKKLGYPQVDLFWWVCYDGKWVVEKHHGWNEAYKYADEQVYSAPTVAELGETLPTYCFTRKIKSGWSCNYAYPANHKGKNKVLPTHADTEANARAKMVIYLLENKIITL